jgi:acetyl esterase/lipase
MLTNLLALMLSITSAAGPTTVPLWGQQIPGPNSSDPENIPTLTIHLAPSDRATGSGVVICPGGGYSGRAVDHEGTQVANWLNQRGVHAFILKYRTVNESKIAAPTHPGPMFDVHRAIRTVRSKAKEYGVDPGRVGVWGFSAGGHLASTAATHFDAGQPEAGDPIDRESCRPDFAILAYPVITMDGRSTHAGSRRNLLGPNPEPALAEQMSNDLQVTEQTPPTFLFHTDEDKGVPVMNSILFFQALKKHNIPAELHVYERGKHGVGLATNDPVLGTWPDRLEAWMKGRGLLKRLE